MAQGSVQYYEYSLNHEGVDYSVITDLQTANVLLNDPEAAKNYIQSNLNNTGHDYASVVPEVGQNILESDEVPHTSECDINLIWSSKKPTCRDVEATELFLKLRYEMNTQFCDKKNNKNKLWKNIAQALQEHGFKIGGGCAERCRQKFANMQKCYFAYIRHIKQTGSEKRDSPQHFEFMHAILGDKDKTDPTDSLLDSFSQISEVRDNLGEEQDVPHTEPTNPSSASASNTPSASANSAIKSRFQRKSNLRPTTNVMEVTNLLKYELQKDREIRESQFKTLTDLMKEQNKQRREFLDLIRIFIENKNPRSSISDED